MGKLSVSPFMGAFREWPIPKNNAPPLNLSTSTGLNRTGMVLFNLTEAN